MDHGQSDFVCLGQLPATMLPHWHSFVHWGSDICHQKVNTSGYQLWQSHSAQHLADHLRSLRTSGGSTRLAWSGILGKCCWVLVVSWQFFFGGSLAKVKGAELLQLYIFGGFMVSFILLISFDQLTSGLPTNITHQVWNCNITAIWTLTVDIAQFYFSSPDPPKDILGITDSSPDWWAGSSQSFYAPISDFADVVAAESTSDPINALALANLQTELQHVGIATGQSSVDVTTSEGLAKLTKNLLFVAGICHSHMYLGREFFTPLMGFVETAPFGHYLQPGWSIWDSLGFEAVVTKIWFTVPSTISQQMILAYGTTSGFSSGVPELGDGPYMVASNSNLNSAVTTFRASLDASRQQVYGIFGDFKNGTFVPGYLYPRQVKKPFGYAITQTSYI